MEKVVKNQWKLGKPVRKVESDKRRKFCCSYGIISSTLERPMTWHL